MIATAHAGQAVALSSAPLTVSDRADLDRLEAVITEGAKAFRAVAFALLEIRDRQLYRETHRSFPAYCRDKLGFSKTHSYRLARFAEIIQQCEVTGQPAPANQGQARRMLQTKQEANGGLPTRGHTRQSLNHAAVHAQRPGISKGDAIHALLEKLRELHASHPWRARADELLDLYSATVLPWPPDLR
jgi:hypothetical protein